MINDLTNPHFLVSDTNMKEQQIKPYSIFELTKIIEDRLTNTTLLKNIVLIGEITKFTKHSSGHIYFTLTDKDLKNSTKKAIVNCTFFNNANQGLRFNPKEGDEVQVTGSIAIYYPSGQYNFNIRWMEKVGIGNLLLQKELLKKKLIEEGVIDPTKKKNLPYLPTKIGIVTSLTGAALKDILKQVEDRYPNINILVINALMQGEDAPSSIANALEEIVKEQYKCDIIILSRGGGSTEDLAAFDHEIVARAIFNCPLPIISGIGHQIDHPISDDVADVAAATPTDAAKIALPIIQDLLNSLNNIELRLAQALKQKINFLKENLKRFSEKPYFQDPSYLIEDYYHNLDDIENRMNNGFRDILEYHKTKLTSLENLDNAYKQTIQNHKISFLRLQEKLDAFSPLATLKRGYSVTYQNGKILKRVEDASVKTNITIQLSNGTIETQLILP